MALDLTDNPATDGAKAVLGKKYGPLPLWVWLIIIGGTVYGVKKFQSAKSAADLADAADASTISQNPLSTGGLVTPRASASDQSVYGGGSGYLPSGSATTTQTTAAADTNQAWLNRAIAFLGQRWNAFQVQTALNRFLSGLPVNDPTDRAIVQEALNSSGSIGSIPQPINSAPQSSSRIVGFVRPAGKVGIFAQYDDGSLVWLKDGISTGRVLESAKAAGIDTNIQERPVNDPIWQNADVVKSNDTYYLWSELWAQYVQPRNYISGRPDIITNPDTISRAQQAWNRSKAVLPSTWTKEDQALADQAVKAAGF